MSYRCGLGALVVCALSACSPPDPIDLSQHPDPLLAARANAPRLRPELIARLSDEFLLYSDSLGRSTVDDFFVGHGLVAGTVAGQRAIVQFLRYTDTSLRTQLAHSFLAKDLRILGTAESTYVWAVDQTSGAVFVEDVGGNERRRGSFNQRLYVRSACLTSTGSAYFVERDEQGAIWRQGFRDSVLEQLPERIQLPAAFSRDDIEVELRGNADARCVLFANKRDSFLVIDPKTEQLKGYEYVESVHSVMPAESNVDRWMRTLRERQHPVTTARDIAVSDDLIAVLHSGRSTEARRVVDFYQASVGYRGSVRLPMRAERIAFAYGRLYALARSSTEALLVSFVLPAEYRVTIDSVPTQQPEGRVPDFLVDTLPEVLP